MRQFIYIMLFAVSTFSCEQTATKVNKIELYNSASNQNQFTFLVFDKSKVDTFMSKYEPFKLSNPKIKQDLLEMTKIKFDNKISSHYSSFLKNTKTPSTSDFNLAVNVINATYDKNGKEYFDGSFQYLFFYHCLPDGFKNKWAQSIAADFRFDYRFFEILRNKSNIIDKMIYGEIAYHDKKLDPILGIHIFNEITQENAKKIKQLIMTDKSFDDARFKTDKDNFIYFLDKTINNEWRLLLTDWN